MASPVMTQNPLANLAAAVAIAASLTSNQVTVDASTKFEVQLQFDILTGAAVQTAGVATVKIYRLFGAGPQPDNVPITQLQISLGAVNTHYIASLALSTGKYGVNVTNGDTANGISYSLTSSTIDAIN